MYLLERGVRLTGTDAWSWDAPFVHTAKKYGETAGRLADLGRPQGRPRHRLLPPREAAQPRGAAGRRLLHQLLSAQDPRRLGRLDARGRDLRRRADGQRVSAAMAARPHPRSRGPQLARVGQRRGLRLPDPEPALRGVPPRRQQRSLSRRRRDRRPGRRPRRAGGRRIARRPGARCRASLRPAGAQRLLRARPQRLARVAPRAVRRVEDRAPQPSTPPATAWCRKPTSSTPCRHASATTPTSTPRSTMR